MIDFRNAKLNDMVPQSLASIPEVEALSFVIEKQMNDLFDYIDRIGMFYNLDNVSEDVLDFLAIDLGTQYYEQSLPIENKRNLIKNTMGWYFKAGTIGAVEELVDSLFTSGEVVEWFNSSDDDVDDPYKFMVRADFYSEVDDSTYFRRLLKNVKNARSWLSKIQFLLKETLYNKERFFYRINFRMPIYEGNEVASLGTIIRSKIENYEQINTFTRTLDGTWLLDGSVLLNAIPSTMVMSNRVVVSNGEEISVTINGEPV